MSDRFPDATLDLSLLPAPAAIQSVDYEAIAAARISDFAARYLAKTGLVYDVTQIETDPGVIAQEEGAYREVYNLEAINRAVKAVMILFAEGTDQDQLYALLGIRRLTISPADPTATPPKAAVMEDDEAFRARAQIALEGTAPGLTGGGYASIALRASAEVTRVQLVRAPGGVVHVYLQGSNTNAGTSSFVTNPDGSILATWTPPTGANADGTVSGAAIQAVAAALNDDWSPDPATGSQLTDIPLVASTTPVPFSIAARAIVAPGPSLLAVAQQSLAGLVSAASALKQINSAVPIDALIAGGRLTAMSKFYIDSPTQDIAPAAGVTPFATSITLTVSRG